MMAVSEPRVVEADLSRADHAAAVLDLIDAYARDPMGDGRALDDDVRARLIPGLRAHPTTLVFLAFQGERALGVAVCFVGYSTFRARPLVNIHDLAVLAEERGRGIGRLLLEAVERKGRALSCCKVTLEVQEGNRRARSLYESFGFAPQVYREETGGSLFMAKPLL